MQPADVHNVSQRYRAFADDEAAMHSATYAVWARGVADDRELCDHIRTLSPRERQPNLLFGVLRLACPDLVDPGQREARPDEYQRFRAALLANWTEVVALASRHHTQTNEVGRVAALLPAFHTVHRGCGKPLALVELGSSAGLLLHPESWRYRFVDVDGRVAADFTGSRPLDDLQVTVDGPVDLPNHLPPIEWRVGADLNPLDSRRVEVARWLRTLVWPGQVARLRRLEVALAAAATDPVRVIPRDLTTPGVVAELIGLVPTDYHPVVFHSAVLAYLPGDARRQLAQELLDRSRDGELSWVSYEGAAVIPQVAPPSTARPLMANPGDFVVAINGQPQYLADGHATWIRSLDAAGPPQLAPIRQIARI